MKEATANKISAPVAIHTPIRSDFTMIRSFRALGAKAKLRQHSSDSRQSRFPKR
jgi:hypothetical protein